MNLSFKTHWPEQIIII